MKLLLAAINAKYIHSNLAIYSLQAYARERGILTETAEYTMNQNYRDILKDLYLRKPDVIAFSCYLWNISMVEQIAREWKKLCPDTPLWAGGPEVSYDPEQELREHSFWKGIMVGEGEETFSELAAFYQRGDTKLPEIAGIVYRDEGQILRTKPRSLMSMNDLVFPYRELSGFEHKILYYETSRGCPYSCSYCLSSIDKGIRLKEINRVKQELAFFLEHGVPQVKFVDRTFNCVREHALEIWRFIKDHDNGVTNFHFEIAGDLMDQEELEVLAGCRPGLVQLEIGVQTIQPETIRAIHRKMDLERLSQTTSAIKKGGNIHQHLDLIAGLPLETFEQFQESFNYVYRLKPDQLQLGFLKVLKGTAMYEDRKRYGIVFESSPPYEVLFTRELSYEQLLVLKGVEEMVDIYCNSGQFQAVMAFLEHFFDTPFALYRYLADYYEEKGLGEVSCSRMERYDILRDMMLERGIEEEALNALLLFDLYGRENLKSRPGFAPVSEDDKKRRRLFFAQEERLHKLLPHYESYGGKQMSRLLHLEFFPIDIQTAARNGTVVRVETAALFDYRRRDPLRHQAQVLWMKTDTENILEVCNPED